MLEIILPALRGNPQFRPQAQNSLSRQSPERLYLGPLPLGFSTNLGPALASANCQADR